MTRRKGLLLLSPVDLPTHPYASVPQLVAWLRSQGRPVDALDLNLELFRWLLEPARLRKLSEAAWEELSRLNGQESLDPAEQQRFSTLKEAFEALSSLGGDFDLSAFDLEEKRPLRLGLANIAFVMGFPLASGAPGLSETVCFTSSGVLYQGFGDFVSSRSLLNALERRSLLDDFFEEFLPARLEEDYLFAGISVPFSSQCEPALRMARAIKKVRPGLHVCLGGNFVGLHLRHAENPGLFRHVDSLVVGDGERPLLELFEQLESERPDLGAVSGSVTLADGAIRRVERKPSVPLEEIPAPLDVFDRNRYLAPTVDNFLRLRLSEGCSWAKCAFCNLAGSGLYPLQRPDEERIFEKVRALVNRGERFLYFGDDESDPETLERFSRRVIEAGLEFHWTTNVRFGDALTLERAMLMRQAGCNCLAIGLESYHDRVLSHIRKGTTVALIDRCLDLLAWSGIPVMTYVMVGLPTETEEEARVTFERVFEKVREGQIRSVMYNLYAISRDSPVDRNPARFGVTGRTLEPGRDLRPGYSRFEHSGLSQQRAAELYQEFCRRLRELDLAMRPRAGSSAAAGDGSEIRWCGGRLALRPDAGGIASALGHSLRATFVSGMT